MAVVSARLVPVVRSINPGIPKAAWHGGRRSRPSPARIWPAGSAPQGAASPRRDCSPANGLGTAAGAPPRCPATCNHNRGAVVARLTWSAGRKRRPAPQPPSDAGRRTDYRGRTRACPGPASSGCCRAAAARRGERRCGRCCTRPPRAPARSSPSRRRPRPRPAPGTHRRHARRHQVRLLAPRRPRTCCPGRCACPTALRHQRAAVPGQPQAPSRRAALRHVAPARTPPGPTSAMTGHRSWSTSTPPPPPAAPRRCASSATSRPPTAAARRSRSR
jgi:hypothetical protein